MKIGRFFRHIIILFRTAVCFLFDLASKHKEIVSYAVFGALTTAVDWGICFLLYLTPINHHIVNVIAWVCAVLFAFFTNRRYVFKSERRGAEAFGELVGFALSRVLSLGVQELLFFIFVDLMEISKQTVKIPTALLVVIINYVLSKTVFTEKYEGENDGCEDEDEPCEPDRQGEFPTVRNGALMIGNNKTKDKNTEKEEKNDET